MRAVIFDVPEWELAKRSRLGHDIRDEMWDGVLHMTPSPSGEHQRIGSALLILFGPLASKLGLIPLYETSVYRANDNYRVPDLLFISPASFTPERGAEGPVALAVEIRSPRDETYQKLDFYAARGVAELLVVNRDTKAIELFVLDDGQLRTTIPDNEGWFRLASVGVLLRTVGGKVEVDVDGTRTLLP